MRRAHDLLVRFLLTLALIVAAMPLRASAELCASPPSLKKGNAEGRAVCAMPCCAAKPAAPMACALPVQPSKTVKAKANLAKPCGCELRSVPAASLPARVVAPSPHQIGAILSRPPVLGASGLPQAVPGLIGFDSGPPPRPPQRDDASRAPPVVRA